LHIIAYEEFQLADDDDDELHDPYSMPDLVKSLNRSSDHGHVNQGRKTAQNIIGLNQPALMTVFLH